MEIEARSGTPTCLIETPEKTTEVAAVGKPKCGDPAMTLSRRRSRSVARKSFPRGSRFEHFRGFLTTTLAVGSFVWCFCSGRALADFPSELLRGRTATPIQHLVIVWGENISFDHYFGTYPRARNLPGETPFFAAENTPHPNNLLTPLDPTNHFEPIAGVDLLNRNPNFLNPANGAGAANPFRLGPSQAATQDQTHFYTPEQQAVDNGLMDLFPKYTGAAGPPPALPLAAATAGQVMAYYDGNTVTALWNYAQSFALNDNAWTTVFGSPTPGALSLISGQTNGVAQTNGVSNPNHETTDGNGGITLIGDPNPLNDVCVPESDQADHITSGAPISIPDHALMAGRNIGDLLNDEDISWGAFMGGFDLTITAPNGTTGCTRKSDSIVPGLPWSFVDYIPHQAWFQYYESTANWSHARPSSVRAIGHTYTWVPGERGKEPKRVRDPANHQYDIHDFFDAVRVGNFPAVSFLKAPAVQDGHPAYSDPIDEQHFLVDLINFLQRQREWESTAVVLVYSNSDGWYDHQASPIVNPSSGKSDVLNGKGICNRGAQQGTAAPAQPLLGNDGRPAQGRCGYGTRIPLMVISPWARRNHIDHTLTDQTSVLRFIEDNWLHGRRIQPGGSFDTIAGPIDRMFDFRGDRDDHRPRTLFLDPDTGAVIRPES